MPWPQYSHDGKTRVLGKGLDGVADVPEGVRRV